MNQYGGFFLYLVRTRAGSAVLFSTLALLGATPARSQVLEIDDAGIARPIGGGWAGERPPAATAAPAPFAEAIAAAAARYDLSPDFLDAVARSESGYDARAVSPAGAIGVMQLMPSTARSLGVDPWNPAQNIMGGAAYLRAQLDRFDGDIDLALAAYNAGEGRVIQYGGVPPFPETRAYVARNLDRLASRSLAGAPVPSPTNGDRQ